MRICTRNVQFMDDLKTNILVSGVKAGARILLKNGTVKYCTVPKRVKPLLDEAAGNQDVAEPIKY